MTAMRALSRRDAAARIATTNTMAISATTLRPCPIMLSLPSLVQNWWPMSAIAVRNWASRSA